MSLISALVRRETVPEIPTELEDWDSEFERLTGQRPFPAEDWLRDEARRFERQLQAARLPTTYYS